MKLDSKVKPEQDCPARVGEEDRGNEEVKQTCEDHQSNTGPVLSSRTSPKGMWFLASRAIKEQPVKFASALKLIINSDRVWKWEIRARNSNQTTVYVIGIEWIHSPHLS
ncbi:MAG: hypothetical protein F6J87_00650 [Spirulina sp. SIO3F2]|nr:hypothetical protein [Spirulina sp. SIO3F2]